MGFLIIEFNNPIGDAGQFIIVDEIFFVRRGRAIGREAETIVSIVDNFSGAAYSVFVFRTVVHHRPIISKRNGILEAF